MRYKRNFLDLGIDWISYWFVISMFLLQSSVVLSDAEPTANEVLGVIPPLREVEGWENTKQEFVLAEEVQVVLPVDAPKPFKTVLRHLKEELSIRLTIITPESVSPTPAHPMIFVQYDEQAKDPAGTATGPEGYSLKISPRRIDIKGNDARGAFYALQTIRELYRKHHRLPAGGRHLQDLAGGRHPGLRAALRQCRIWELHRPHHARESERGGRDRLPGEPLREQAEDSGH